MLLASLLSFGALALAAGNPGPGTYEKDCARFEEDDFLTGTLELGEAGAWLRTRTAYEEESCLTPWIDFREEGAIISRVGEKADIRMERVSYRPRSAEVAEALSISAFCGKTDWRADIFTEVSGRQCGDYPAPAVGETVYTRLKWEENSLRLGEEDGRHDGGSEDTRHGRFEEGFYRLRASGFSK